jgi:hypothetical protein
MSIATKMDSYGLGKVEPSFANNKGFFMVSTVDLSSIIDFSLVAIDEGVIDSPSSKEIGRTPLHSPSFSKNSKEG